MIDPKNLGGVADQVLVDMQTLMVDHPSTIDVLCGKAILGEAAAAGEDVGNIDYESAPIDWEQPIQIKMLEVKKEIMPAELRDSMAEASGFLEEFKHVLLSEKVPEQSVISVLEFDSTGGVDQKDFMVVKGLGIGRDGRGGTIYQIATFMDTQNDMQDEVDEEIAEITGAPVIDDPDGTGFVWSIEQ